MATFDDAMTARIKAFQQANGLAVTGAVGPETWEGLVPQKTPESQVAGPESAVQEVMLDPEEFPLTYELATLTTEEAVVAFLNRRGIDLEAIVAYREATAEMSES
ncbi:MAG: peptidoglycan-binding domain-containing protein [Streptosporangiaceae bacterium]|jgi:peptidoglycan hydrolase-like protein with peptidoglycan-binding domain